MFAIRHNPTGGFLPNGLGRKGRGGTHVEPTCDPKSPPRLFYNEVAARNALTWWLRGKVDVVSCSSSYESFVDDDEEWKITSIPERRAEDMQIVSIRLQFMDPFTLSWRTI